MRIYEAVKARDADAAERAIMQHIDNKLQLFDLELFHA
jgi:DNA-binding GntR family transcriptional regulator